MQVWIELLIEWINRFKSMSLEDRLQLTLGHDQALIQAFKVRVIVGYLFFRHALGGLAENVGHVQQVFAELLYAKDLSIVDLFGQTLAKVFAVC